MLAAVDTYESSTKPRRSKITAKSYTPGQTEEALTTALQAWRKRAAGEWLRPRHHDIHGGHAVLTDKVIRNIVMYASKGKITSIESLQRETHWSRARKYGAQVLDIVHTYFPLPSASTQGDNSGPTPLGDSRSVFVNLGIESVSISCCEACCMICKWSLINGNRWLQYDGLQVDYVLY